MAWLITKFINSVGATPLARSFCPPHFRAKTSTGFLASQRVHRVHIATQLVRRNVGRIIQGRS